MKKVLFALSLSAGLAQAGVVDLPAMTAQIGDINVPEYQTEWGTNPNWNDGDHSSIAQIYGAMNFNQYDGSQGDLLKVTVRVRGAWTGRMFVSNLSNTNDTSLNSASLEVKAAFDIFNDYDGSNTQLIEASGFSGDANYYPSLVSTDNWNNPPLPITVPPLGQASDENMSGTVAEQVFVFDQPADLAKFQGNGQWSIGCFYGSNDNTDATGGTPAKGHEAWAQCSAEVIYTVNAPQTTLSCGISAGASGTAVTASLSGDESCSNLQLTQTITCTGLSYTVAASLPNCTVTENPSGTLNISCTNTIAQNGQDVINAISAITGDDGSCTTAVTSMSCTTPTNQNLNADVSQCRAQYSQTPPPPPVGPTPYPPVPTNVPTLSQWGLILLSSLLGLVAVRRRI